MSKLNPTIKTLEDITFIKLLNIPADMKFVAEVFDKIAKLNVDVDMISLSESGDNSILSFTVKDNDFIKTVEYTSKLRNGSIKPLVSSGNYIISVVDDKMENTPGVAANVFNKLAESNVEIMLITTSESQISVLVRPADYDNALEAVNSAF